MEHTGMTPLDSGTIMIERLTKAQVTFLIYCKSFGWGKLEVTVKNGEPVMVSPIRQEVKLD